MKNLLTILGPTATGKTKLAAQLASAIDGEIISADSRQVYRKMDIGTGKDLDDYVVNGTPVAYHLVDIAEPGYEYNLFEFYQRFVDAFKTISSKKKMPVLCGGTGLYLDAVLSGYEMLKVPENILLRQELENEPLEKLSSSLSRYGSLHNSTDTSDKRRVIRALEIAEYKLTHPQKIIEPPEITPITFGIDFDRKIIRERITKRLKVRLNEGMIEEVKALLDSGLKPEQLTFYGLEYRYVTLFVTGEITYPEMFQKLNIAIHQFAKRQSTWFRRMERKGVKINWIDGSLKMDDKVAEIMKLF